jgi:hypothetical protein
MMMNPKTLKMLLMMMVMMMMTTTMMTTTMFMIVMIMFVNNDQDGDYDGAGDDNDGDNDYWDGVDVIGNDDAYDHDDGDDANATAFLTQLYKPVMRFYEEVLKVELLSTTAIYGAYQPEATVQRIREYLEGLDKWHLAAVDSLSASCRSLLTGVACMHGVLRPEEALRIARLEEEYQVEEWGLVEGGHDIDNADTAVRVTAPLVFVKLLEIPTPSASS